MAEVRLIDANAIFPNDSITVWSFDGEETARGILKAIDNAPTIDAVPVVHARWVHEQRYGDSGGWVWRCSACRRESITCIISAMKYCHACGAKMDGGASDG